MKKSDFFVAGGTLRPTAPSYVRRPADDILPQLVVAGELCYILNTRQMGKSSLMAQTIHFLRTQQQPIRIVILDLSPLGRIPSEQWHYSLADEIAYQLKLTTDVAAWWQSHAALEYTSRFLRFFQEIVLVEVQERLAIFIDEVDNVIKHPFSDDFFAAIRMLYNKRATEPAFTRIAFVLLGTVAPHALIKDYTRTPFNVGHRLQLNELKLEDAQIMVQGLPNQDTTLLERIFYWTNGHPYLTQKIGQAIARQDEGIAWTTARLDALVHDLFLTEKALTEESNLQFIRERMVSSPHKEKLLALYSQIYQAQKKIRNQEQSFVQQELKLTGLIDVDAQGFLTVRNRIYRQAFNRKWIGENQPVNWWQWGAIGIALVSLIIIALLLVLLWREQSVVSSLPGAVRIEQPPTIDGRLDDPVWSRARPLPVAVHQFTEDSTTVTVRLLWDDQHLYVGFDVNDTQVEGADETPWDGDSVSVILEGGAQLQEYRHSLLGLDRADRRGNMRSSHHLKAATTFDDGSNFDVGYTVEMQIPWPNTPTIDEVIAVDLLSVDHDQNPGKAFNDPQTRFSKVSWDGDANIDTANKQIRLLNSCATAQLVRPTGAADRALAARYAVSHTLTVAWEPAECTLIVQAYQDNELIGEYKSVTSGTELLLGDPHSGETEIKIWSEGFPNPTDSTWVWIE